MSDGKALATIDAQGAKVIERAERRVIRQARRVVEQGALDATEIDDDGPVPEGWSDRRRRIARDMRASRRNAPVYIDVLTRVVETHDKIEAAKGAGPQALNIGVVNIVQAPVYPTLDLDRKE